MNKKNGYVALMTVFIISLSAMTIALFMLLSGVDMTKTSLSLEQSSRARSYADSCVQIALEIIRNDINYIGAGNQNFSSGSCSYEVINLGGENREVRGSGLSGDSIKRVKAEVNSLSGSIGLGSWQEVVSF